jgi:hypothetical protein
MRFMMVWVKCSDGELVPLDEYDGPKDEGTELAFQPNPIYAAWLRNTVPPGADLKSPEMRARMLDFFERLTDRPLSPELAAELDGWRRSN